MIVFDWDDTLCPSHWIRSNRPALHYFHPCPNNPKYKKPLLELSEVVCNVLRLAAEIGNIVIITNAQVNWVETSARNFMPSVSPLLQQLNCHIVYARAAFEMDLSGNSPKHKPKINFEYNYNANIPQQWKNEAFMTEMTRFYSKYQAQSWKNVISIGDQCCERDAVRGALAPGRGEEEEVPRQDPEAPRGAVYRRSDGAVACRAPVAHGHRHVRWRLGRGPLGRRRDHFQSAPATDWGCLRVENREKVQALDMSSCAFTHVHPFSIGGVR